MQYYLNRRYYPEIGSARELNYGFTVVNPPSPYPRSSFTTEISGDQGKIKRRQLIDGNVLPIALGYAKRHAAFDFSFTLAEVYREKLGAAMGNTGEHDNRSVVFRSASLVQLPHAGYLAYNTENLGHHNFYRSGQRQLLRRPYQAENDTSPVSMIDTYNSIGSYYDYRNYHPLLNRTSDHQTGKLNKHTIFGVDTSKLNKGNYLWGIKETGIYLGKGITVSGIPDGNKSNLPTLVTAGDFNRFIIRYNNRKSTVYPYFHEWAVGNDARNIKPTLTPKAALLLDQKIRWKIVGNEASVTSYGAGAESVPLVLSNVNSASNNWNGDNNYVVRAKQVALENVFGANTIKDSRYRLLNFKGRATLTVDGVYIPKDEEHYYFVRSSFVAKGANGNLDDVYLYNRGPIHFDSAYGKHFQFGAHGQFLFGFTVDNAENLPLFNLPVESGKHSNDDFEYYEVGEPNEIAVSYRDKTLIKKWFAIVPCLLTRTQRIKIEMKTGMIELMSDDPKDVFIFQRCIPYLPGYRESFDQFVYKQVNADAFDNPKQNHQNIGFRSRLGHMNGDLFGEMRYASFNMNFMRSCYYDVIPDPEDDSVMYIVHPESIFHQGDVYLKAGRGFTSPSSVPGLRDALSMDTTLVLNSTNNRPNNRGVLTNGSDTAHNLAFGRRQIYQRYFANFQAPWMRQNDHSHYSLPFRTLSTLSNDLMKIQPLCNLTDYNTLVVHPRSFDNIPDWYPGFKAGTPNAFQRTMHTYPSLVTHYLHGLTDTERREVIKSATQYVSVSPGYEMWNALFPIADRVWVIPQDDISIFCLESNPEDTTQYARYRIVLNPNRIYASTDKIRVLIVDASPTNAVTRNRTTMRTSSGNLSKVYFYELTLSGDQINDGQTITVTDNSFNLTGAILRVDNNESNRFIKELTNLNPRFKHFLWVLLGSDFNSYEKLPNLVLPSGVTNLGTGTQTVHFTSPTSKLNKINERVTLDHNSHRWRGMRRMGDIPYLDDFYLYPYSESDCDSVTIKTSQCIPIVIDNVPIGLDADEEKIYWDQILPAMPIYPIYVDYGQSTNTRAKHIPWGFTAPPNARMLARTPTNVRGRTHEMTVNGGDYYANNKNGTDNKWYFGYNRNGNVNVENDAKPFITVYGWDIHGVWRAYDIIFKDVNYLEFGQWQKGLDVRDHRTPALTYEQAKQKLVSEGWGERQYIHYKCNSIYNGSAIYNHFDLNKGIVPMLEVGSVFSNVPSIKSVTFNYMKLDNPGTALMYTPSGQTTTNRPTTPCKIRVKEVNTSIQANQSLRNFNSGRVLNVVYEHVEQSESTTYNPYLDIVTLSPDNSSIVASRTSYRNVTSRTYDANKKELTINHNSVGHLPDPAVEIQWSRGLDATNYAVVEWEDSEEKICNYTSYFRIKGDTNNVTTDAKSNCFSFWEGNVRVICSDVVFDPDNLRLMLRNVETSLANNINFEMRAGNYDWHRIYIHDNSVGAENIQRGSGDIEGFMHVDVQFTWETFRNVVLSRLFNNTIVPPATPMKITLDPEGIKGNSDAKWMFSFVDAWFRPNKQRHVWYRLD